MSTEPFDAPGQDGSMHGTGAGPSGRIHLVLRVVLSVVSLGYGSALSLVALVFLVGMWRVSQTDHVLAVSLGGFMASLVIVVPAALVGAVMAAAAMVKKRWAMLSFAVAGCYFFGAVVPALVMELLGTGAGAAVLLSLGVVSVVPLFLLVGVWALSSIERRERYALLSGDDDV